jgi:type I restriction enzyme S subunit
MDNCQRPTVNSQLKKGYKQTEVGVIPEKWEIKNLGDCFTFSGGYTASRDQLSDDGYCYLHYGDIHGANRTFIDIKKEYSKIPKLNVNIRSVSPKSLLNEGDVVFVDASEDDEGASKHIVVFNSEGIPFISGLHTIVSKSKNDNIDNGYKRYCFQPYYVKNQFKFYAVGTKVTGISKTNIAKILIPLPTKAEQTAIAAALSDADALITQLEKLIAKKRDVKQGAMQELLTGKKRLPGFSGKWEVKELGEIFTFLNTANNSRKDLLESGEIGYIHYGDIHTRWSNFLDCSKSYIPYIQKEKVKDIPFLENGDLVVADASEDYEGIGVCVEIKNRGERNIVAGLHTLLLRGNKTIVADGFKGYLREIEGVKDALIRIATGISVYGISKNSLKNVEVKIPPIEEQTAIAQVLSDMDAEIEALEKKLDKYRMIKQGMMQDLLTGKIRLV